MLLRFDEMFIDLAMWAESHILRFGGDFLDLTILKMFIDFLIWVWLKLIWWGMGSFPRNGAGVDPLAVPPAPPYSVVGNVFKSLAGFCQSAQDGLQN